MNEKELESRVLTGYECFAPTVMVAVKELYSGSYQGGWIHLRKGPYSYV